MARCFKCKSKGSYLNCKYCNNVYCTRCLQIENHECKQSELCIQEKKRILKETLTTSINLKTIKI